MTSRREFFGLLAAAPVAVPAIANAVMADNSLSVLQRCMKVSQGERVGIYPRAARMEAIRRGILSGDEVRNMEGLPPISWAPDTPNRLYGAQINADGEAT